MLVRRFSLITLLIVAALPTPAAADPPELESWTLNLDGSLKGYAGIAANIRRVRHSTDNVYINTEGVPAYTIGPWPANVASAQDFLFRIPRNPTENMGMKDAVGLGTIGVFINGVSVFNNLDGKSYNDRDVWHQNAVVAEATDFDSCLGHANVPGTYHHHQHPICLYTPNPSAHSPILAFAFDGYPIYGAYGYDGTDGTGGIVRIKTSYQQRNITVRTTKVDGSPLPMADWGPAVDATFPLGIYAEDHEFVSGLGHLDAYNGRFAVTPEYPNGTYAYYTTIDASSNSAYPYAIADNYYGNLATDNVMTMGKVTISETVTEYTPNTLTVTLAGTGVGTVTSAPSGINCGADCGAKYVSGTAVTLTAAAAGGSTFTGWSGDCTGATAAVVVNMTANKNCTATFAASGCADPNEPNNAMGMATAMTCADFSTYAPSTCIADSTDTDWYSLVGTAGQLLAIGVSVEGIPSTLEPQIKLYNAMGAEVKAATGNNGIKDALLYKTLTGGTYFVSVSGLNNSTGFYRLRALCRTLGTATAFDDVPMAHTFYSQINAFSAASITSGCSTTPSKFCPDDSVTRAQMAVFIVRALGLSADTSGPPTFTDVPASHEFYGWIQKFAALGITSGCGTDTFCPDDTVTREQMAVFIVRALSATSRTDLGPSFTDVPAADTFYGWIETFSALGITGGCGTGIYCPDSPATRGQMAVFIVVAFGLLNDGAGLTEGEPPIMEGAPTRELRVLNPVREYLGGVDGNARQRGHSGRR